jgi:kynurenine formamidase
MTAFVTDPYSGLQLVELSHVWGHGVPSEPGQTDVRMVRAVKHSQHGVLAWRVTTSMHTGTHMNAPIHMVQRGDDLAAVSPDRLFGNGVVLSIPKKNWELVTAADLEAASPAVQGGDIVVIVTGWHHKYSDGLEYFGEAPGLTKDTAEWLIKKNPKFVAVDTPFIDVPLATSMGPHRGGPQMKRLAIEYNKATGKDAVKEFPEWYPAHKALAAAGIPTVEQVGGDVDELLGKRATMAATPWKFEHGDACPVRMIAMVDPSGSCRVAAGN